METVKFIALGLLMWLTLTLYSVYEVMADEYTPTTVDIEVDGQHTLKIYADVKFVQEDDEWIPLEDAKSLMDKTYEGKPLFDVVYLKRDERYDFEVLDFNFTDIKFNMILKDDNLLAEAIPFRVDEKAVTIDKKAAEATFTSLDQKVMMEYKTENIFAKNYTIGAASTTITIIGNVSSSTADLRYQNSGSAPANAGGTQQIWNLTALPSGKTINNAMACYHAFEFYANTGVFDDDLSIWRVNDHGWDETINVGDFNAQSLTNPETETWNVTFTGVEWSCFSVLTQLNVDYIAGWDNFTYRFEDPDNAVGVPDSVTAASENTFGFYVGAGDNLMVKLGSRDLGGGGSDIPQLTITYSDLLPPSFTYEPNVSMLDSHVINATFLISDYGADVRAHFSYNDTLYDNDSVSMNATHVALWRTFTAPLISQTTTSVQLYVNFSNATYSTNTTNYTQTITRPFLADCIAGSYIETKRLVLRNETSFVVSNGTIEGYITWSIGGNEYSYNFTTNNITHRICIYPNSTSIRVDGQFHYFNTSDTEARDYYLDYELFDNVSEDIDLFQIDQSLGEQIRLRVKDQFGDPYPNVLVQVRRWYPSVGSYKTVASLLSDDSGRTSTYIRLNDVEHAFVLSQDGVTLQTITKRIVTTADVADYIDLVVSPTAIMDYLKYGNKITGYCSFSETTDYLSCQYTDTSGYVTSVDLDVHMRGAIVKSEVCDITNTTIPSGRFECYVGNATGKMFSYVMIAQLSTGTLDEYVILNDLLQIDSSTSILFGDCSNPANILMCQEGIFLTIMLTLASALTALYSPPIGMMMMLIGLAVCIVMGLFAVSWLSFIGFVFVALVIIYKMRGSG